MQMAKFCTLTSAPSPYAGRPQTGGGEPESPPNLFGLPEDYSTPRQLKIFKCARGALAYIPPSPVPGEGG